MGKLQLLQAAKTLSDVADLLEIFPSSLSYILYKQNPTTKYALFAVPKRNGEQRLISAPCDGLKRVQRNLATFLQDCMEAILEETGRKDRVVHGFRRGHSSFSNARRHRHRRWVFNLDLKDFFPSINFGRVRGFLIKDNNWALSERVATVLAQIACHDGSLPQGSPCSPVFGNLIAHILDIRLLKLCAQVGCTYSRYADDLTFSTNKKEFPQEIAFRSLTADEHLHVWLPGDRIRAIISKSGFSINDSKTAMMYRRSRQEVTGLVVNQEIRPKIEYRRLVRTMVHKLVTTGEFQIYRPIDKGGTRVLEKRPGTFDELHGMLGFVDYARYKNNEILGRDPKIELSSEEETYRQFLIYRLFYAAERPTVLCEGDTDNVYLVHAIRSLAADFPALADIEPSGKITLRIRLYRYPKSSTRRLLKFNDGGSGVLANFIRQYKKDTKTFGPGLNNPVVILFDNDDGSKAIRDAIKSVTGRTTPLELPFLHLLKNLYAVPTPGTPSTIEDFFDPAVKARPLEGKVFHPGGKDFDETLHFGKRVFAHQIIRPNADSISFEQFRPLLEGLSSAIAQHHASLLADEPEPASPA